MPKFDLALSAPLLNAAGSLGFAPDPRLPVDWSRLGAFITNPVSLSPRRPAQGRRCLPFPGGFLLHTGYPNPGLRAVIRQYAPRWERASLPVWVHILISEFEKTLQMVRRLEGVEGVAGIELGVPPHMDLGSAVELSQAISGELPLVLRLPFELSWALNESTAQRLASSGLAAISLAPPRGSLIDPDGSPVTGRLYGPGLFPQALGAVQKIARFGLPVIGAGGVYRMKDAEAMIAAGAAAVQLDAVLWRGDFFTEEGEFEGARSRAFTAPSKS